MADSIPVHLRITGLAPSNEDVDSRRAAVANLATAWGKLKTVDAIIKKATETSRSLGGDGRPSEEFGAEIEVAVQKYASAFLFSERPLEVGVCAGMAAVSLLNSEPGGSGWTVIDIYSNALWSALAFQPVLADAKRENLRREVMEMAQRRSIDSAEKARERMDVAEPIDLIVAAEEGKFTTNFKKAAMDALSALRRNAMLDREEIDFLWWSQLNRSRLLAKPLVKIKESTRLVAAGIEASTHLRRLPAQVHRDLVLRTSDEDPELDLAELLVEIAEERVALSSSVNTAMVSAHPAVFPLLSAILLGSAECEGASKKRAASDWGSRALLEASLSRLASTGMPSK